MICPGFPAREPFRVLAGPVLGEVADGQLREDPTRSEVLVFGSTNRSLPPTCCSARPAALGRALGSLAADDGCRAGDPDFGAVPVDVIPVQVGQLAPPGAGAGGEVAEG